MPNTYNPMQMQQMQYMNAPPDIQAGASQIFQQQKLAELLRQQAMEPIKADEYSKTGSGQWAAPPQIVKVGIGQGLAKLAQAGLGGYMENKANQDNLDLANQLRDRKQSTMGQITDAMSGTPAQAGQTTDAIGDQPSGAVYTDDQTAVPAADQQGYKTLATPATPPADRKTLAKLLMNSEFPDLQKMGETQLFTPPPKVDVHTVGKDAKLVQINPDGTNSIIAQGEPSRVPPLFKEEYVNGPKGEPMVQKMTSIDNGVTWKPEGATSPRFARQITPVIRMPSQGHIVDTPAGLQTVKDGVMTPVLDAEGKPAMGSKGTINLAGGKESTQIGRLIGSANQASKDLENISKLPLTVSSGFFGARGQGQGLLEAGKETLTNKMTTQEVQSYNAMTAGLQRSLAGLEAMGLMPNVNLTKQMESVVFRDGDTNLTKMHKLAQTRQIIEATQETLEANPRVAPEQKKLLENVLAKVKKSVPFTHSDLIDLTAAQQKNPSASMRGIIAARDKAAAASGGSAPAGWSKEEWAALTPEEKASLDK